MQWTNGNLLFLAVTPLYTLLAAQKAVWAPELHHVWPLLDFIAGCDLSPLLCLSCH
jgi:hypothetical protein